MGPPDCWARLPTPSFYQKANPEEEAKSLFLPLFFLFLLFSPQHPPTSTSVHLNPLGFSRTAYTYPPTNTTTTSNAVVATTITTTTTITTGQVGSFAPLVPRPAALFPPQVTLYLLPLVGFGACPYRVCYYYLTLSIIPKRAGSPLRDCDSPRD